MANESLLLPFLFLGRCLFELSNHDGTIREICPDVEFPAHRADEIPGALERDDFTCWLDNLGEIDSRITRASAHVQDAFGVRQPQAQPAVRTRFRAVQLTKVLVP